MQAHRPLPTNRLHQLAPPLFLLLKTQVSRSSSYFSDYNLSEVLPFPRFVKCTHFWSIQRSMMESLKYKLLFMKMQFWHKKSSSRVYSGPKLQKKCSVAFLCPVGSTCCWVAAGSGEKSFWDTLRAYPASRYTAHTLLRDTLRIPCFEIHSTYPALRYSAHTLNLDTQCILCIIQWRKAYTA